MIWAAVFLLSLALHSTVLNNFFLRDDAAMLLNALEPHAFQKYFFGNHGSRIATLLMEHHFFGAAPAGYYAVNVILHSFNAVLAGVFAQNLARRLSLRAPLRLGILVSLCFAFITTPYEATYFISAGDQAWCGLFYFPSCIYYLRFTVSRGRKDYGIFLALAALAVLAKPAAVSVVIFTFLLDVFLGAPFFSVLKRNAAFIFAAAAYPFFFKAFLHVQFALVSSSKNPSTMLLSLLDALSDPVVSVFGFVRGPYLHGRYYYDTLFYYASAALALKTVIACMVVVFCVFAVKKTAEGLRRGDGFIKNQDASAYRAFFLAAFSLYFFSFLPYTVAASIDPLDSFFSKTQMIIPRYLYIACAGFSMLFCGAAHYVLSRAYVRSSRLMTLLLYGIIFAVISLNALNKLSLEKVLEKQGEDIQFMASQTNSFYGKRLDGSALVLVDFPSFFVTYHGVALSPLLKLLFHVNTQVFWADSQDKETFCSLLARKNGETLFMVRVPSRGIVDGTPYISRHAAGFCK